jgi:hypothetical protein
MVLARISIIGVLAFAFGSTVHAQEARHWSEIDCATTKIVAPAGLKCRATQLVSGSDSQLAGAGAGGQFRRWTVFGTTGDGTRVFYYASEAAEPQSWTRPTARLEEVVRGFNRDYQKASAFTELAPLNGGDYQRFVDPSGANCVVIRKLGPSQSAGYKWYLVAGKCAAKGATISEPEIVQFMNATGFRA